MCGIVAIIRKDGKPAYRSVLKRYNKQRDRGVEGYGYVAINDGKIVNIVRSAEEHEIKTAIEKETATTIVFHHRTPTSTPNVAESAHPLLASRDTWKHNYYLVHNGIISNADELKKAHEALGIKYRTNGTRYYTVGESDYILGTDFNDSEALAVDVALYLEGLQDKLLSRGSVAFVVVQEDKQTGEAVIRYGRNDTSPLVVQSNANLVALSSEGVGEKVTPHTLNTLTRDHRALVSKVDVGTVYTASTASTYEPKLGYHSINAWRQDDLISGTAREYYQNQEEQLAELIIERDGIARQLATGQDRDGELGYMLWQVDEEINTLKRDIKYGI